MQSFGCPRGRKISQNEPGIPHCYLDGARFTHRHSSLGRYRNAVNPHQKPSAYPLQSCWVVPTQRSASLSLSYPPGLIVRTIQSFAFPIFFIVSPISWSGNHPEKSLRLCREPYIRHESFHAAHSPNPSSTPFPEYSSSDCLQPHSRS